MDGNTMAMKTYTDKVDKNEKRYAENIQEFNDVIHSDLGKEISFMMKIKNDDFREEVYEELQSDFNEALRKFDIDDISFEDWISEEIGISDEEEWDKIKAEMRKPSKIKAVEDMGKYSTAVINFIDALSLPQESFPRVYDYFVEEKKLELINDYDGKEVFDWGSRFKKCSITDIRRLYDEIKKEETFAKYQEEVKRLQSAVKSIFRYNKEHSNFKKGEIAIDVKMKESSYPSTEEVFNFLLKEGFTKESVSKVVNDEMIEELHDDYISNGVEIFHESNPFIGENEFERSDGYSDGYAVFTVSFLDILNTYPYVNEFEIWEMSDYGIDFRETPKVDADKIEKFSKWVESCYNNIFEGESIESVASYIILSSPELEKGSSLVAEAKKRNTLKREQNSHDDEAKNKHKKEQ